MATLASLDQFLTVVEKSRLIEPARLRAYLDELTSLSKPPADPAGLARRMIADRMLTRFQAVQLLAGRWQGFFLLGKFKVLSLLGAGGSGRVYLCEQLRLERLVAVKVLPIVKSDDAGSVDRFYREARAAASLNHPNIVRVHDVDRTNKFHIMVLEYVDGASLQELISRAGPISPVRAAHYVAQASAGLQHAFEAGWIHRDVKPANILLARSGVVQLLDLGLARALRDKEMLTQMSDSKSVMGTVDYISPEQAMSSSDVDIRTDIYSMGATLRFLLVGDAPFPEGSLANKLLWRQIRDPDPITSLRQDVPEELCQVVYKMMARNPADRYQTPWDVVEALRPWTGEPIAPPTDEEMPDRRLFGGSTGSPSVMGGASGRLSPGPLSGYDTPNAGPVSTLSLLSQMLGSSSGPGATSTRGLTSLESAATATSLPRSDASAADTAGPTTSSSPTRIDPKGPPTAGTLKPVPPPPQSMLRRLADPWLERRRLGALVAGAGALVVLAAIVGFFLPSTPHRPVGPIATVTPAKTGEVDPVAAPVAVVWETTPPMGRQPLLVVPEGDAPERLKSAKVFRTLQQAVDRATPGDVIRVCPPPAPGRSELVFAESITLRGLPANVVIEAIQTGPTAPRIDWVPAIGGDPEQPLVKIVDCPGLKLRGFRFDGKKKLKTLVSVSGQCNEAQLQDLDFVGFHDRALAFAGAIADPPIVASGLAFRGSEFAKPGAAVSFENAPVEKPGESSATEAPPAFPNDGIALRECRFDGLIVSAVRVTGPTKRVDVARSRFNKCDYAFDLAGVTTPSLPDLSISSNTFYQAIAIFEVGDLLAKSSRGKPTIVLENNLFIRCDEMVKARSVPTNDVVKGLFASLAGNFKEPAALNRGVFFSEVSSADVSAIAIDRNDDATFLRTPKAHRLYRSGVHDASVGAP